MRDQHRLRKIKGIVWIFLFVFVNLKMSPRLLYLFLLVSVSTCHFLLFNPWFMSVYVRLNLTNAEAGCVQAQLVADVGVPQRPDKNISQGADELDSSCQ